MKRYRPIIFHKEPVMLEDESGNYTSLTEYYTLHDRVVRAESQVAYLKAENERLRSASFVTAVPSEQYEQVIKAGDEMADTLNSTYTREVKEMNLRQWQTAKEGKESK